MIDWYVFFEMLAYKFMKFCVFKNDKNNLIKMQRLNAPQKEKNV